jgi:hypothetical protein
MLEGSMHPWRRRQSPRRSGNAYQQAATRFEHDKAIPPHISCLGGQFYTKHLLPIGNAVRWIFRNLERRIRAVLRATCDRSFRREYYGFAALPLNRGGSGRLVVRPCALATIDWFEIKGSQWIVAGGCSIGHPALEGFACLWFFF